MSTPVPEASETKREPPIEIFEKRCHGCGQVKGRDEFHANRSKFGGVATYCKTCSVDKQRHNKQRLCYGPDALQIIAALWDAQGGRCWICDNPLDPHTFCCDHDHARDDKHIRALLHNKCNSLEGTLLKNRKKTARIQRLHSGADQWPSI